MHASSEDSIDHAKQERKLERVREIAKEETKGPIRYEPRKHAVVGWLKTKHSVAARRLKVAKFFPFLFPADCAGDHVLFRDRLRQAIALARQWGEQQA